MARNAQDIILSIPPTKFKITCLAADQASIGALEPDDPEPDPELELNVRAPEDEDEPVPVEDAGVNFGMESTRVALGYGLKEHAYA